ncbi:TetR/AcrR family transcriptional regulator [Nocardioides sp. LHG3406-4]|uniref:TetR/AcrR family transcriptional regulator n=1 Tax=Nocardioides sp. LHG3406-4 TaxID=2804575 RepID=UPI003CE8E05E
MGRVSREKALEHRSQIVDAAARQFRERGFDRVSIADLMKEVHLTHGGFYKQFASKDVLLAEATQRAFEDLTVSLRAYDREHDNRAAAKSELIDYYLSPEHRDDLAQGCPSTGLSADLMRSETSPDARLRYAEGVEDFARWLGDHDEETPASDEAIREASLLVGALVLARASAGTPLSDRILAAVRGGHAPSESHAGTGAS